MIKISCDEFQKIMLNCREIFCSVILLNSCKPSLFGEQKTFLKDWTPSRDIGMGYKGTFPTFVEITGFFFEVFYKFWFTEILNKIVIFFILGTADVIGIHVPPNFLRDCAPDTSHPHNTSCQLPTAICC